MNKSDKYGLFTVFVQNMDNTLRKCYKKIILHKSTKYVIIIGKCHNFEQSLTLIGSFITFIKRFLNT